jgi:hypothetical protein
MLFLGWFEPSALWKDIYDTMGMKQNLIVYCLLLTVCDYMYVCCCYWLPPRTTPRSHYFFHSRASSPHPSDTASFVPVLRYARLQFLPLLHHLRPLLFATSSKLQRRPSQLYKKYLRLNRGEMPFQKLALDALEEVARQAEDCCFSQNRCSHNSLGYPPAMKWKKNPAKPLPTPLPKPMGPSCLAPK